MRLSDQSDEDEEKLLRLAEGCDPASLVLSPAEGFLLSRIDGRTSRGVLRRIGALAPAEIDRCVTRWRFGTRASSMLRSSVSCESTRLRS